MTAKCSCPVLFQRTVDTVTGNVAVLREHAAECPFNPASGWVLRFTCPKCAGHYFGSAREADGTLTRICNSCRSFPAFRWTESDDPLYFVVTDERRPVAVAGRSAGACPDRPGARVRPMMLAQCDPPIPCPLCKTGIVPRLRCEDPSPILLEAVREGICLSCKCEQQKCPQCQRNMVMGWQGPECPVCEGDYLPSRL